PHTHTHTHTHTQNTPIKTHTHTLPPTHTVRHTCYKLNDRLPSLMPYTHNKHTLNTHIHLCTPKTDTHTQLCTPNTHTHTHTHTHSLTFSPVPSGCSAISTEAHSHT